MIPFVEFPKMPRLNRDCVITEKIDGTNAQIYIVDKSSPDYSGAWGEQCVWQDHTQAIFAGSRNRWIFPGKQTDNAGFAAWVYENAEDLLKLGPGRHFGEWWGNGIQRGYGLKEKRFSLFNAGRWCPNGMASINPNIPGVLDRVEGLVGPSCCHVVPILYRGAFNTQAVQSSLDILYLVGSSAAPEYPNPEGVIVYHEAAKHGFKVTLKNDQVPKSLGGDQ